MVNGAAVNVHMQGFEDLFSVLAGIGPEVPWSNLDSVFNILRSGRNIFHSLCLFPLKLLSRYDFHKTKRSHLSVGLDDISLTVGLWGHFLAEVPDHSWPQEHPWPSPIALPIPG